MRPVRAARPSAVALVLIGCVLVAPAASAHVPEIAPEDRAFDGSRSWAFYDELPAGGSHRWTFDLAAGDRIFLLIAVPREAPWSLAAVLTGPTGELALEKVDRIGYEPVTPYAARDVWSYDAPAPVGGTYEIVVSGAEGEGGRYALGVGLNEGFTVGEWVGVPIAAVRIHLWEGQPLALVLAPHVAALALLFVARGRPATSRLLAALYLGTALALAMQLLLALAGGASPGLFGYTFTGVEIAASASLAWGAWRARRAWAFAALGVAGAVVWSGLLIGPAFALAVALAKLVVRATLRRAHPVA